MKLLEKTVNDKTYITEFDLDGEHLDISKEVLECLEGRTVKVLNPVIVDGEIKHSEIALPILEWLPIVCSSVSFDTTYGRYFGKDDGISHAYETLEHMDTATKMSLNILNEIEFKKKKYPFTERKPNNMGKIVLARELKQSKDAFRFVLAHEIHHAINILGFVYPAMLNWENLLDYCSVCHIDDFQYFAGMQTDELLDDHTNETELVALECFFGKSIREWHEAYLELCEKGQTL